MILRCLRVGLSNFKSLLVIFRTPFFLPWILPELIWRVPTEKKEIFLTFDDGPVPGPTEFVLDALAKFNAKATFFCIGDNIRKHSEIFVKILSAGHSIGNHTFGHLKGWDYSTKDYVNNIELCTNQIATVSNRQSTVDSGLFRPPYGRITKAQIRSVKQTHKIIMWDVLTQDYRQSLNKEYCLAKSVKVSRPGSIVVFHDSLKAERNLSYVLPKYLEHFSREGYIFSAL
ncbi:MAG: polysaccharide deacetylase family protein [Cyclobacteriaceae bacterium]|nr:polysaccharide deacetylase family protein [Cyclobacteriaceae bacterium]